MMKKKKSIIDLRFACSEMLAKVVASDFTLRFKTLKSPPQTPPPRRQVGGREVESVGWRGATREVLFLGFTVSFLVNLS